MLSLKQVLSVGLEKGQSEGISLRSTSEENIRKHKCEKDLRRENQNP